MKLLQYLLILVLSYQCIIAKDKYHLLKPDVHSFIGLWAKESSRFQIDTWDLLYQNAEREFDKENYATAQQISEKARNLADKLNNLLIIYKSYRQLAKIELMLGNNQRASVLIQKAFDSFRDEQKRIAPSKIELETEDGYLYYYWSLIYSNPDFSNTCSETALKYLSLALSFNSYYSDKDFDDPYVATSLQIARCFGMNGNQIAKMLWIENAKLRLSQTSKDRQKLMFQIHYELQEAYQNLGVYSSANSELQKLNSLSNASPKSRILFLRAMADFNSGINNRKEQAKFLDQAIDLAQQIKNQHQLAELYSGQMLRLLNEKKFNEAENYLQALKKMNPSVVNKLDLATTEAVLAVRRQDFEISERFLANAESILNEMGGDWRNEIFLRSWQSEIYFIEKDYEKLLSTAEKYVDVINRNNFVDFLPEAFLYKTKALIGLGKREEAQETLKKLIDILELRRRSESAAISIGVIEGAIEAYQLQTDLLLQTGKSEAALQSSESQKGRWLADKIAGNALQQRVYIDPKLKNEIFNITLQILKNPKDSGLFAKLSDLEKKSISFKKNDFNLKEMSDTKNDLHSALEQSSIDEQVAVVTYFFSNDGKINACTWQRGKGLRTVQLPTNLREVENLAIRLKEKIRTFIFFKNEGQQIYEKLLKPLNIQAKHIVIIPDGALWKIPFQALSEDGKTYLIENTKISYAPSVSILLRLFRTPSQKRETFQVFSNSRFGNINLKYADLEAKGLAMLFGVNPELYSTAKLFYEKSGKSDILHFSMHAEVNNDEPFNSFLGFMAEGNTNGKLTVNDLLKIKLKKGSMVFLASCDTNNVLNGEGLVSLAWGMMAAGASTVISTQWEANDKSTGLFSKTFYEQYKKGLSSAEALQKASLELIRNKSGNMHEPYYWADFTLNGDFR